MLDLSARSALNAASAEGDVAVRVVDASFAFGPDASKPVLVSIDFTLKRSEFVILTGPSGAGKTTLLTLIGTLRSV